MKYKLLTKWGISFALIISIFFNSVGSIFAKSEQAQEQVFESQKEEVTRKVSIEKEISLEAESDKVEKEEVLTQERQTASYTLSKSKFQEIYHNQNGYQGNPYVNTVAFTDQPLPAGTTIVDISENGDGSVLACNDNGNLIVTSNTPGVKVKLPSDSSFLFSLEVDGDAWNRRRDSIDVSYVDTSEVTNMQAMFASISGITRLDLSSFDTRNVRYMSSMFAWCDNLEDINLSSFNTSNVFFMNQMFGNCEALQSLDLRSFNTRLVRQMNTMFMYCTKLETLDLNHFDTSNVTNMGDMFNNCASLRDLKISNFNTSNVRNMAGMFMRCQELTNIDINNFDISNVTNMMRMFFGCTKLTTLNFHNARTPQLTNTSYMFANCSSLTTIYSEAWDTSKVTSDTDMFLGCEKVAGKSEYAAVTPFDSARITKEMATPDDGYFTVPGLIEWTGSVHYVDKTGQILGTYDFLATNRQPIIRVEKIKEHLPSGYESVQEITPLTVTQDKQIFEIVVQKIQWTVEIEYQTADGIVIKTEPIHVTQINPVVNAQVIAQGVPTGYELVHPASDWTATANGDKHVVTVREIPWMVSVEYQIADGTIIKTESIHVTQINPVVNAQVITQGVPTGYELVNTANDFTPTANGEKHIVVVREILWTVNIEYQTADGNVVKTEPVQVTQVKPIVNAQMIVQGIPMGYQAVHEINDKKVTKDKETLIVPIEKIAYQEIEKPVDENTLENHVEGVQTKDTTQANLWIMFAGVSLGILIFLKKRSEKNNF